VQPDLREAVRRKYQDAAEVASYRTVARTGLTPFEAALLREAFQPGDLVLDVGCGGGREAVPMARAGLRPVAMDISPAMVQSALEFADASGFRVPGLAADLGALPFRNLAFDGIAMLGQVIAHVPGREGRIAALAGACALLRPGGVLAMTAHNRRSHWKFILYFALVNRWRRLRKSWSGPGGLGDNDRWSARISPGGSSRRVFFHMYHLPEALDDLRAAGFQVLRAGARVEFETGQSDPVSSARDYLLGFIARRPA